MRIAHLISSSGFFGAEKVVLTLAEAFSTKGTMTSLGTRLDFVSIGTLLDQRQPNLTLLEKARERKISTFTLESRGRFDFRPVSQLKAYLKVNKIDVLHTHNYKSDLIGFWAAQSAGIPVVATAHGFTDMTQTVSIYEGLDRWMLKHFFGKVVVVTNQLLKDFPVKKRVVIPNGVLLNDQNSNRIRQDLRRTLGVKDQDYLVATIGRLSKEKNQILFLEAAQQLITRHRHVKFLIVGSGPEEHKLKQKAEQMRLSANVIFTGLISDISPIYQAIDLFVLSSLTEGIPMTILEAMASRVPVVATRVGGVPELIDDRKTGLLVPSNNALKLADRIEALMLNQGLQKELTINAFELVKSKFSLDSMVESYRKVYQDILQSQKLMAKGI